jgi:outer membrane protein TolC
LHVRCDVECAGIENYIQLHSLDRDSAVLDDTVKACTRALHLTEQWHDAGITPGHDVSRAQTQEKSPLVTVLTFLWLSFLPSRTTT